MDKVYYIVISKKTGRPYVSPARTSIAFGKEEDAEDFCKKNGDFLTFAAAEEEIDAFSRCYAAGAGSMIYRCQHEEIEYPIEKENVLRNFYNRRLTYDLNAFRHDRDLESFYDLANCSYIVASRISDGKDGGPMISFAVLRAPNDTRYVYLAFTSLDTYTDWAAKAPGWSPVLVDFDSLVRICGDHGFLLDPMTARYSLNASKCRELKLGPRNRKGE